MKREELFIPTVPDPVHWFPLTQNGNDVIGTLVPQSGRPTYTSEGALITSDSHKLKYGGIPLSDFKSVSMDFICNTNTGLRKIYTFYYVDQRQLGGIIGFDWSSYTPCQFLDGNSTWYNSTLPISDFEVNRWYKLTFRITDTNTDVFIDKQYVLSCGKAYSSNFYHYLYIGGREVSGRSFYGKIRDFKMWNVPLTDDQIKLL